MRTHHIQSKRDDIPNWVMDLREPAWNFTMDQMGYGYDKIVVPPVRFSYSARFCTFYHGHPRYFHGIPHIRLVKHTDNKWWTYKRKTVGLYADGIEMPSKQARMKMAMVHEFTHAVQWHEKKFDNDRKMSEVETTRNVIEFVKQNYPEQYNQLKTFDND